jgi:hypothetical protein
MKSRSEYLSDLINISKCDLEDSLVLYGNKSYRNAVYLLQQSVEKAMKAWAVMIYNKLDPEKLGKKIWHFSPRAFYLLIEENLPKLISYITDFSEKINFPEFETLLEEEIERIKTESKEEGKYIEAIIKRNESTKRRTFFKMGEELLETFKDPALVEHTLSFAEKLHAYDEITIAFIEMLISIVSSKLPPDIKEIIDMVFLEISRFIREFSDKFAPMILLSLITYPYALYTRYPNKEIPLNQFNMELGIIKHFQPLVDMTRDGITWLEEFSFQF